MKKVICLTLLLYLTACSSQYKIKGNYIAPLSLEGKEKVKKCLENKKKCDLIFNQKKEICLIEKEKEARSNFPKLRADFLKFQRIHKQEWEDYQSKLKSFEKKYKEFEASLNHEPPCDISDEDCIDVDVASQLSEMENRERPHKPIYAIPLNLSRYIKKLQQTCSDSYSCIKTYDSCFISSGGEIGYYNTGY